MLELFFIENEINFEELYEQKNEQFYVKDGFYKYIVNSKKIVVNLVYKGIKCVVWFNFNEDGGVGLGECVGMFVCFFFFQIDC